jgi:hypothetical protein
MIGLGLGLGCPIDFIEVVVERLSRTSGISSFENRFGRCVMWELAWLQGSRKMVRISNGSIDLSFVQRYHDEHFQIL